MRNSILVLVLILISSFAFTQTNESVNHKLFVRINPETSMISVTDSISFPAGTKREFLLNADLSVSGKKVSIVETDEKLKAKDVGMDRDDVDGDSKVKLNKWQISTKQIVINYKNKFKWTSFYKESTFI